MMTEREALIAAIIQNPDADTPRLAFADWCDDNGDPERAAFVRCQIELATEVPAKWPVPYHDLSLDLSRQKQLHFLHKQQQDALERMGTHWLPGYLPSGFHYAITNPNTISIAHRDFCGAFEFVRGFVERLTLDWTTFRNHADTLTASHPIRGVTLTTMPQYVASQGRYVMHIYDPKGREDATLREMMFSTTNGYEELCRLFKDWLKSHWKRIAFNLPSLPGSRISFENPLL